MTQKNDTIPLLLSLLVTSCIIGGGIWWFLKLLPNSSPVTDHNSTTITTPKTPVTFPDNPFPVLTQVAMGTTIRINGSTSMVQVNELLKQGFIKQYPGTIVIANASGTEAGIQDLLNGKIDLAAISRPLTPAEQQQGLVAIPVVKDAIAVFVGKSNSFTSSLTQAQITAIFTGNIQNWSEVGGANLPLRVINRAPTSGTRQFFQEVVLGNQPFGNTPNITSLTVDETTPIIRDIGTDGISYATYSQVANQSTARIIPIDGLSPQDANYPFQRVLYYVYQDPAGPSVQAFLGYIQSPEAQQLF